jgi:PIN domain nuclease of toxin-antitoxin system
MKILLDTCTFLWIISDDPALSQNGRALFTDPEQEIYLSSVSVWEIVIKNALGKLPLPMPPMEFVPKFRSMHGILELPLYEEAVLNLTRLPGTHKDPFDRMLICQAIAHSMALLSPDPLITQYPVKTLW